MKIHFVSCIFLLLSGAIPMALQAQRASPNIIFIMADDQGYGDLGAFFQNQRALQGFKAVERSPSLDKMAGEGAILTNYYCAAPICAPSRASILLGVSQGHSNVRDNQFDKALDDNYTMASTLRQLGYSTAAIGKWGLEGNDKYDLNGYLWPAHPLKRGFNYYFGYMRHADGHEHYPKEALYRKYWSENSKSVWQGYINITDKLDRCYTTDLWTAMAKKYIVDHVRGNDRKKPFFLYLAFDAPHAVQELPAAKYPAGRGLHGGIQWVGIAGRFINTASGKPDTYIYPEYANAVYDDDGNPATADVPWPETFKRYATANRRIDDAVGDVMQLLKDLKIDSNTIVVYTSDNGPSNESYLPEEKFAPNRPTFFASHGPFEGMKADTWEGGIHLPAIAWWPGHVAAGKHISLPVIAYDWAPTFIDAAGQAAPQRMDGVSLLPVLTGKGKQRDPLVYIEYKGDDATPDYKEFSAQKRGRIRGQMQMLRAGDYGGVRYNIKSADDDFEIYHLSTDPAQLHNLAGSLSLRIPVAEAAASGDTAAMSMTGFQSWLKSRVMQVRHAGTGSPRPYDSTFVPAAELVSAKPGLELKLYKGSFPWIPQTAGLSLHSAGEAMLPQLSGDGLKMNMLSVFSGYIKAPADGEYTFYMSCDAKAFLRIHDIQVIDEDYGYPGNLLRTGSLFLKAGYHPISFSYYRSEDKGEPFLKLDWSGPGLIRQRMQKGAFFRSETPLRSGRSAAYYIDSKKGNDKNSGRSERQAWKSFAPLNALQLKGGDSIRLRRGSSFVGPLIINNSGEPGNYITITDYGNPQEGAPALTNPMFEEGNFGNCVRVKGSYVVVEKLFCYSTAAYAPVRYQGDGWVEWEMGAIHIDSTARHCIVRNNEMKDCVAGIRSEGEYALIENNFIHDCNRPLKEWNWGPLGIWLGADHQEVRYNRVFNMSAVDARIGWGPDSYGGGADGGAFEIDDARRPKEDIDIHHNYTRDCQGFLEVTWTDVKQNPSYRNFRIHHNVSDDYQQFVALWRGEGCYIENNTIVRRKVNANDWGVFNMTQRNGKNYVRNNIIVVEKDVVVFNVGRKGTAKPATIIAGNLYFAAAGKLDYGKEGPGEGAIVADPLFVNYNTASKAEDFEVRQTSPAAEISAFGKN